MKNQAQKMDRQKDERSQGWTDKSMKKIKDVQIDANGWKDKCVTCRYRARFILGLEGFVYIKVLKWSHITFSFYLSHITSHNGKHSRI